LACSGLLTRTSSTLFWFSTGKNTMLEVRTKCDPQHLIAQIQDRIDSKKIRVWTVAQQEHLVLQHKKHGGTCKFVLDKKADITELYFERTTEIDVSRIKTAMTGVLDRQFKDLLLSITIRYNCPQSPN